MIERRRLAPDLLAYNVPPGPGGDSPRPNAAVARTLLTNSVYAPKTPKPVWTSCATMPAMVIIARRPLLSSLFCISRSASGSFGFSESGSKPTAAERVEAEREA